MKIWELLLCLLFRRCSQTNWWWRICHTISSDGRILVLLGLATNDLFLRVLLLLFEQVCLCARVLGWHILRFTRWIAAYIVVLAIVSDAWLLWFRIESHSILDICRLLLLLLLVYMIVVLLIDVARVGLLERWPSSRWRFTLLLLLGKHGCMRVAGVVWRVLLSDSVVHLL